VIDNIEKIKYVSVIGAGLMGHGIAQVFAARNCHVTLVDTSEEILSEALVKIRSNLTLMAERGIGHLSEVDPIVNRVHTTRNLDEAAANAQFVVEAVSEDVDLKQTIFRKLDALCPDETVLATNTSVISITEIAAGARGRERIVGTHFWNPPYLIPLVEVIRGDQTAPKVVDATIRLLKHFGKRPVRVDKDVPGFVGNRLQHALWREAISIVESGIAEPAVVDEVVKYGFGMRLPFIGPLETADMIGLDLTLAVHGYLMKHLERSPGPSPLLQSKVEEHQLGLKTGKGFYEWTPEQARQARGRLIDYLLKRIHDLDRR
jgi:3-hydroxybutyryl-CoA dehydrogenase